MYNYINFFMSLTLTACEYKPKLDNNKKYIDNQRFKIPENGTWCPCINRSKKIILYSLSSLKSHLKTKSHIKWLEALNTDDNTNEIYKYKYEELLKEHKKQKIEIGKLHIHIEQLNRKVFNLTNILVEKQDEINMLNKNPTIQEFETINVESNMDLDID